MTPPTTAERSLVTEIPVIEFIETIAGFPDQRRFALVQLEADGVLYSLRSLDDPGLRFLVIPPMSFFPAYAPAIDASEVAMLGAATPEELLLLVVLRAGDSLHSTTANLKAPIVVNAHTRQACQLILDNDDLAVDEPLIT